MGVIAYFFTLILLIPGQPMSVTKTPVASAVECAELVKENIGRYSKITDKNFHMSATCTFERGGRAA